MRRMFQMAFWNHVDDYDGIRVQNKTEKLISMRCSKRPARVYEINYWFSQWEIIPVKKIYMTKHKNIQQYIQKHSDNSTIQHAFFVKKYAFLKPFIFWKSMLLRIENHTFSNQCRPIRSRWADNRINLKIIALHNRKRTLKLNSKWWKGLTWMFKSKTTRWPERKLEKWSKTNWFEKINRKNMADLNYKI